MCFLRYYNVKLKSHMANKTEQQIQQHSQQNTRITHNEYDVLEIARKN